MQIAVSGKSAQRGIPVSTNHRWRVGYQVAMRAARVVEVLARVVSVRGSNARTMEMKK